MERTASENQYTNGKIKAVEVRTVQEQGRASRLQPVFIFKTGVPESVGGRVCKVISRPLRWIRPVSFKTGSETTTLSLFHPLYAGNGNQMQRQSCKFDHATYV